MTKKATNTTRDLYERAQSLAAPLQTEEQYTEKQQVLLFKLGEELYALEALYVRAVYPIGAITPLPNAPSFIQGLINVRQSILPLLNLKILLALNQGAAPPPHPKALVVEKDHREFALLIDEILQTQSLDTNRLHLPLNNLGASQKMLIKGSTPDGIAVLEGKKLLEMPWTKVTGKFTK